jgi:rare lipoprotein A (peptidoglycan hydrolase)
MERIDLTAPPTVHATLQRHVLAGSAPLCLLTIIFLLGSAQSPAVAIDVWPPLEQGRAEHGLATWYGPGFAGGLTACGYRYDPTELTAASNVHPCGAVVEVESLHTGAVVAVTVTDTGAFSQPVLVDLSPAAFSALADLSEGVVQVKVTPR